MADTGGRRRTRGFTLVEILVAFAILALTFAAVMQAFSGGLRMLSISRAQGQAVRIAENRLAEAGSVFPLAPGTETGAEGRYRWRVDMALYRGHTGSVASLPPAYAVTVTVRWGGNRSVTLSTIDLGPPTNE